MNVKVEFQNITNQKDLVDRLTRTLETLDEKREPLSPNVLPIFSEGQQLIGSMAFEGVRE